MNSVSYNRQYSLRHLSANQGKTEPPGCMALARWAGCSGVQVGRHVKCQRLIPLRSASCTGNRHPILAIVHRQSLWLAGMARHWAAGDGGLQAACPHACS